MGKATIISHIADGEYNININLDSARIDARIAFINQRLTELSDTLIPAAETALSLIDNELAGDENAIDSIIDAIENETWNDTPPAFVPGDLVTAHNTERTGAGLGTLSQNSTLDAAAQSHANYMASIGILSHTGSGNTSPNDRIVSAGYNPEVTGENVAGGPFTVADVMTGWMNSTVHRENILFADYTEIGVGFTYAETTPYKVYWCVTFGKPA